MSDSEKYSEPDDAQTPAEQADDEVADRLVGEYTDVDGEGPHVRGVAGEYTRSDGVDHEGREVGDYVTTEENPVEHDASERPGKYVRADHGEPHEHKHHDD